MMRTQLDIVETNTGREIGIKKKTYRHMISFGDNNQNKQFGHFDERCHVYIIQNGSSKL